MLHTSQQRAAHCKAPCKACRSLAFFASLLYSMTNTVRSSSSSVSLSRPTSPLLAVHVRLLLPWPAWPTPRFCMVTLWGKLREAELCDGAIVL